jgi:hypothetical protein
VKLYVDSNNAIISSYMYLHTPRVMPDDLWTVVRPVFLGSERTILWMALWEPWIGRFFINHPLGGFLAGQTSKRLPTFGLNPPPAGTRVTHNHSPCQLDHIRLEVVTPK